MKNTHFLFAASFLSLLLAPSARADVTYTYTGNPFNYFDGTLYGPADSVRGSITFNDSSTFDPSSRLRSYSNIVDYSFTDGVFHYTFSNADQNTTAFVEVDAHGRVALWGLFLDTYVPNGTYTLVTTNAAPRGFMDDFGEFEPLSPTSPVGYGEVDYNPGAWTGPNPTAATPELPSLALLGTGLAGVARVLKRRRTA